MDNEDLVSYKIAHALWRCGYNGQYDYMYPLYGKNLSGYSTFNDGGKIVECITYYGNDIEDDPSKAIPCPTLAQAQKWLREKKGVEVVVKPLFSHYTLVGYDWTAYDGCCGDCLLFASRPFYDAYEFALSAGIEAALKLIEEGKR